MIAPPPAPPALCVMLAFNAGNQLAVRQAGTKLGHAFVGADVGMARARLLVNFPSPTPPAEYFTCALHGLRYRVFFTQVTGEPTDGEVTFRSLEQLAVARATLAPALAAVLDQLEPYLIEITICTSGRAIISTNSASSATGTTISISRTRPRAPSTRAGCATPSRG